ncbi:MAG TPA: hypothetical protein VFV48_02090 [Pseudomonadales bacterium]|nr:hypothetical protein [Pseudomonadales bacterium]
MHLKIFLRLCFFWIVFLISIASKAALADSYSLTVSVSEGGRLTSPDLADFACGQGVCTISVPAGSSVRMTANALTGYSFKNWDGACTGTNPTACTLQINGNTNLSAYFKPVMRTLKTTASSGGGIISLSANINCYQSICYTNFLSGTTLTLSALPLKGYTFTGWGGACSGAASDCRITMDAYKSVSANFVASTSSTPTAVQLQWTLPTQREDGSLLSTGEITQQVIYFGKSSGVYSGSVVVPSGAGGLVPQSLVIEGLDRGLVYYFAGVTIDAKGLTSRLSNEISRLVQ